MSIEEALQDLQKSLNSDILQLQSYSLDEINSNTLKASSKALREKMNLLAGGQRAAASSDVQDVARDTLDIANDMDRLAAILTVIATREPKVTLAQIVSYDKALEEVQKRQSGIVEKMQRLSTRIIEVLKVYKRARQATSYTRRSEVKARLDVI